MDVINWRTKTEYVDTETGEIITEQEAKTNYIIIKKSKHATIKKTTGYVKWTYHCKRSNQIEINFE